MTTRQWILFGAAARAVACALFLGTGLRPTVSLGVCAACLTMACALGGSALNGVYEAGKAARKEEEQR